MGASRNNNQKLSTEAILFNIIYEIEITLGDITKCVMRKALVGSWVGTTEKEDKMADNPDVVFPAK